MFRWHRILLTGEGMSPADLDLALRSVGLVMSLVVTSTWKYTTQGDTKSFKQSLLKLE